MRVSEPRGDVRVRPAVRGVRDVGPHPRRQRCRAHGRPVDPQWGATLAPGALVPAAVRRGVREGTGCVCQCAAGAPSTGSQPSAPQCRRRPAFVAGHTVPVRARATSYGRHHPVLSGGPGDIAGVSKKARKGFGCCEQPPIPVVCAKGLSTIGHVTRHRPAFGRSPILQVSVPRPWLSVRPHLRIAVTIFPPLLLRPSPTISRH